jgi:hypothetical protein
VNLPPSLIVLLLFSTSSFAQDSLLHFNIEAQSIYTSKDQVPFWVRSNQYGSIPLSGPSSSFISRFRKDYNPNSKGHINFGLGFEARASLGNASQALITEAYGKVKLGVFEFIGGRSKDVTGLVGDSSLSSGSFSISGNALGVPKVQFSIPEYYSLPLFNKLLAIKGGLAHGWLGDVPMNGYIVESLPTFFHQSSLYGRIGRPSWKLKLYIGINHQAFWGSSRAYYRPGHFNFSLLQEYWAVVTSQVVENSRIGNHLGSVDLGLDYQFNGFILKAYRQNIYDYKALFRLANLKDGLNGLTIVNTKPSKNGLHWKSILIELLYTKSQAFAPENYYINHQYPEGWSYHRTNLGSPFITSRQYLRENLSSLTSGYFVNDRVRVFHSGIEGSLNHIFFATKVSYSKNYGRHKSSAGPNKLDNNSIGNPTEQIMFHGLTQLSTYLECRKTFKNKVTAGLMLALDHGKLLYNSKGLVAHISKSF